MRVILCKFVCIFFLTSLSQFSFAKDSQVTILGINEKGEEVVVEIPKSKFGKHLSRLMTDFNLAAIPALTKADTKTTKWKFSLFKVGASITFAGGLGDAIKGSVTPTFLLIYGRR